MISDADKMELMVRCAKAKVPQLIEEVREATDRATIEQKISEAVTERLRAEGAPHWPDFETHQAWLSERGLPTWKQRTDGWYALDDIGRLIQVRVSRFHGPMLEVEGRTAYLGWEGFDQMVEHVSERRPEATDG